MKKTKAKRKSIISLPDPLEMCIDFCMLAKFKSFPNPFNLDTKVLDKCIPLCPHKNQFLYLSYANALNLYICDKHYAKIHKQQIMSLRPKSAKTKESTNILGTWKTLYCSCFPIAMEESPSLPSNITL